MEALMASYGDTSSDSDDLTLAAPDTINSGDKSTAGKHEEELISLPPPPLALLESIVSTGSLNFYSTEPGVRVRNFPHVDGNYALHVYIPGNQISQFELRNPSFNAGCYRGDKREVSSGYDLNLGFKV